MESQKALVCPLWPGVELHKRASLGNEQMHYLLVLFSLDILFTAMYNDLPH